MARMIEVIARQLTRALVDEWIYHIHAIPGMYVKSMSPTLN